MRDEPQIFITYFGPDKARAIALHRALAAAKHRPWCDAVDLLPGDRWDEVIPEALRASEIILVLVSEHGHDGWYARSEVADAIDQARKDRRRRVIPVRFDGVDHDRTPYGLRRVAGIEVHDDDFRPVLDGIGRIVAHLRGVPPPSVEPPPASRPEAPGSRPRGIDRAAIVDAAIQRHLDRDLLLSWLPRDISARLPQKRSYFEQIDSDLAELIRIGRLPEGDWALAVWLRQAERLAGPFAEARVFRAALEALDAQK